MSWLDRRVDRKLRKKQLARQNAAEQVRSELDLSDERKHLVQLRASDRRDKLLGTLRFLLVSVPITAPMAVAWIGQAGFAMKVLSWVFPAALLYAAAYELTTVFCAWMYHQARSDGDSAFGYQVATWGFAVGSAVQQWWHYSRDWTPTYHSVAYSSMTFVGLIVWELYAKLIHRRALRKKGLRSDPLPKIDLIRWVAFPAKSRRVWMYMVDSGERNLETAWAVVGAGHRGKKGRDELTADRYELEQNRQRTEQDAIRTAVESRFGTVYGLIDPRDDAVRYIGQTTKTLKQRLSGHISANAAGRVMEWVSSLRAEGLVPVIAPLVEEVDRSKLDEMEREQIWNHLDRGCDLLNTAVYQWHREERDRDRARRDADISEEEEAIVRKLFSNGTPINRNTVADAIRYDGSSINNYRAAEVARWGRDNIAILVNTPPDRSDRIDEIVGMYDRLDGVKESINLSLLMNRYGIAKPTASELRRDAHQEWTRLNGGSAPEIKVVG